MTAIILAAGFSRRFGRQKLLAKIAGKPVILHVVDTVLRCGFKENILVCRHKNIEKLVRHKNIKVVFNEHAAMGISSSIRCGISHSDADDATIFFTADQPFINAATVQKLQTAFYEGRGSIIVPRYNGVNGNPVIFASGWKDALTALDGDTGGRKVILENPAEVYYVDIKDALAGKDLDTAEDFSELERLAVERTRLQ